MTEMNGLYLMIGLLVGLIPWLVMVVRGVIRDMRWLGQERRRAERRK